MLKKLKAEYKAALAAINEKVKLFDYDISQLDAALQTPGLDEKAIARLESMKRSKVYQKQYQEALKGQIGGIVDKLHGDSYSTISEYLNGCYTDGFLGTMYSLHQQDIPLIMPIDQAAVLKAVQLDSKISKGLYTRLGVDSARLKKVITSEITRGVASSMSYADIARNIRNASSAPLSNCYRIARTEGHRIQQASAADARNAAKKKGADVLKQWDATLDGRTRDTHRLLDGQIRETDEPFEANGKKAMEPGSFGDPAEDCNCRCVALTRARWALDEDELKTLKERAEYFGLDKTDTFKDFEKKYLKAAESESNLLYYEGERITKSKEYAVDPKIIQSRTYAEKFDHMASSPQERREYLKAAKEMLLHRSGQNGEDLYLYNRSTGKWFKSTAGNEAGTPEYTKAIIDAISKSKPGQLVAFHNHPASMPPSASDLNAALQNGYSTGYIICHDGTIFEYTTPMQYIDNRIYEIRIENYKEKGYNEYDAQRKTLEYLSDLYSFVFKEVK